MTAVKIRNGSASNKCEFPETGYRGLVTSVMQTVDVAYAEEWRFGHGVSASAFPDAGLRTAGDTGQH